MNRRGFLRGALGLAGAAAISASVTRAANREDGVDFLCDEMTKGVGRGSLLMWDNWGISINWDELHTAHTGAFAEQAQAICDAIKPAIGAIAELAKIEAVAAISANDCPVSLV